MASVIIVGGGLPPFATATKHRITYQTWIVPWDAYECQVLWIHLLWFLVCNLFLSCRCLLLLLLLQQISIACHYWWDNRRLTDQELIYLASLLLIMMRAAPGLLCMFLPTSSHPTRCPILRDSHCDLLDLEELSQVLRIPYNPALSQQGRRCLLLQRERVWGCQQVLLLLSQLEGLLCLSEGLVGVEGHQRLLRELLTASITGSELRAGRCGQHHPLDIVIRLTRHILRLVV